MDPGHWLAKQIRLERESMPGVVLAQDSISWRCYDLILRKHDVRLVQEPLSSPDIHEIIIELYQCFLQLGIERERLECLRGIMKLGLYCRASTEEKFLDLDGDLAQLLEKTISISPTEKLWLRNHRQHYPRTI